jgi:hypothetical protein
LTLDFVRAKSILKSVDLKISKMKSETASIVIYWIFVLLGCSSLLSFNIIITNPSFFKSRLISTPFAESFLYVIGLIFFRNYYNVLFLSVNCILVFFILKYGVIMVVNSRIIVGFIVLVGFLAGLCLISITPLVVGIEFFTISMLLVLLGAFATSFASGIYGFLSLYPSIHYQGFNVGQGVFKVYF